VLKEVKWCGGCKLMMTQMGATFKEGILKKVMCLEEALGQLQ